MLHYQASETAPVTSFFLHGFLGSGNNLGSLARLLSQQPAFGAYALVDLPGHGKSDPLGTSRSLDTMADALLELVDQVGTKAPVRLIGHSLGGRVALALLAKAPARFRDVVLLDIGPSAVASLGAELTQAVGALLAAPAEAPSRAAMRPHFTDRGVSPALSDWLLMNLAASEGKYTWRIDREALSELRSRALVTDLWPAVSSWASLAPPRARLVCIRGGASHYVSDADAVRLAEAGAAVFTLPGAGHFVHVDALKPLAQAILQAVS